MAFEKLIEEYKQKTDEVLAMGGPEKLAKRKAEGHLNARERIDYLLDSGSFVESGLFTTSMVPADARLSSLWQGLGLLLIALRLHKDSPECRPV